MYHMDLKFIIAMMGVLRHKGVKYRLFKSQNL